MNSYKQTLTSRRDKHNIRTKTRYSKIGLDYCGFLDVGLSSESGRIIALQRNDAMGHVWTAPAVQEESDVSAKRSGAAMYPACFRLKDFLHRDAAALAAGPDVIR
jgi:hypothetical protein